MSDAFVEIIALAILIFMIAALILMEKLKRRKAEKVVAQKTDDPKNTE